MISQGYSDQEKHNTGIPIDIQINGIEVRVQKKHLDLC